MNCHFIFLSTLIVSNWLLYQIHTEIMTSTVDMREDAGGRPIQKAKVDFEFIFIF